MNPIEQIHTALTELFEAYPPKKNAVLVIGCSTSEIIGKKIGSSGSTDISDGICRSILDICEKYGVYPAFQCCEHLNRALIVEEKCAAQHGFEEVCVVPHAHAGGSMATSAYHLFHSPIAVEEIRADYGIDIGDTLIGMHMKRVCVPVRLNVKRIGDANLVCCRTRPKYIGGERAQYKIKVTSKNSHTPCKTPPNVI